MATVAALVLLALAGAWATWWLPERAERLAEERWAAGQRAGRPAAVSFSQWGAGR